MRRARMLHLALAGVLAAALALASAAPADAGASRTRPGRGGGAPSAGRSSTTPPARPGRAPQRAAGRATYGYGHARVGVLYDRYAPYWRYYYSYGYPGLWWDWTWGWPYFYGTVWYDAARAPRFWVDDEILGAPGLVETDVRPRKATVRLDGEAVGRASDYNGTWDRLAVEPGEHVIEFEAPGYRTLRTRIDVRPGRVVRFAYRLEKGEGLDPRSETEAAPGDSARFAWSTEPDDPEAPVAPGEGGLAPGLLRIRVSPPDAAVYLDGEFLGRAEELSRLHGAIPVAPGRHRIEAVRPGYRSASTHVDVAADEPVATQIDLERQR